MTAEYIIAIIGETSYYDGTGTTDSITNENFSYEVESAMTFDTEEEALETLELAISEVYGRLTIIKTYA